MSAELPLDEGNLDYVTFTVRRELGPDVPECPLCGSRTLRDVPGEPGTVSCVDCGLVAIYDFLQPSWRGARAGAFTAMKETEEQQGTRAGDS